MVRDKIAGVQFFVDNYIDILEYKDIESATDDNDPSYIAAVIGCIEGIFQQSNDQQYLTFLNMYKFKTDESYKFLSLYEFIKCHNEYYKYIVNYFNIWHGFKYGVFTYDEFNKKDLLNNFYDLTVLLLEERESAEKSNDKEVFEAYNYFCNKLSSIFLNV